MESEGLWDDELCPECGKEVEIVNGDVDWSMEIHMQSHVLETENDTREMENISNPGRLMTNTNVSNMAHYEGTENIVFKSHIPLTLDHHTTKDTLDSLLIQAEAQPTCSMKKMKIIDYSVDSNYHYTKIDILNDVFSLLPSELRLHQSFIAENKKGHLCCKICLVTIQNITTVNEHLTTRLHEDRTLQYFTGTLSNELHHIMEFVTFNNSILSCNLCRFNLFMCPDNPNDTILSIMKHNLSKEHLNKTRSETNWTSDKAYTILQSFSELNQVIDMNQHFLEFKMQPELWCRLCDIVIECNDNEISLYKSLIAHFMSETHLNWKADCELEEYNALNISGNEKHNFIIKSKGNIYCSICKYYVKPNVHDLTCHVNQTPSSEVLDNISSSENDKTEDILASIENTQILKDVDINPEDLSLPSRSDYQNNETGNLERGLAVVPQQKNITQNVDETNDQALTSHVKLEPSSEVLCDVSSMDNAQSIPVSKERTEHSTNVIINTNDKPVDFLTIIDNTWTNILRKIDFPGYKETGPQRGLATVSQEKNITQSVDEPNVEKSTFHVKPLNKNEANLNEQVPLSEHNLSSVENTKPVIAEYLSKSSRDDNQNNETGNPERGLATVPQEKNITQSVDEPHVEKSTFHVKPLNQNEENISELIPSNEHNLSSVNTKPVCVVTSIENTQQTTSHLKKSIDLTDFQFNVSGNLQNVLVSQQSNITPSVVEPNVQNEKTPSKCFNVIVNIIAFFFAFIIIGFLTRPRAVENVGEENTPFKNFVVGVTAIIAVVTFCKLI